jgi:UDP-N-acetylmuramate-alanine ligase
MPALRSVDNPADFIDGNVVIQDIKTYKMAQNIAKNIAENKKVEDCCEAYCVEKLIPTLRTGENGDVIVVMSNGSFDGIHQKIQEKIVDNLSHTS